MQPGAQLAGSWGCAASAQHFSAPASRRAACCTPRPQPALYTAPRRHQGSANLSTGQLRHPTPNGRQPRRPPGSAGLWSAGQLRKRADRLPCGLRLAQGAHRPVPPLALFSLHSMESPGSAWLACGARAAVSARLRTSRRRSRPPGGACASPPAGQACCLLLACALLCAHPLIRDLGLSAIHSAPLCGVLCLHHAGV